MSAADDQIYAFPDTVLVQDVGDNAVVLDTATEVYYELNITGRRVVECLRAGETVSAIATELAGAYDIAADQAERDVAALIAALLERNLIETR